MNITKKDIKQLVSRINHITTGHVNITRTTAVGMYVVRHNNRMWSLNKIRNSSYESTPIVVVNTKNELYHFVLGFYQSLTIYIRR